MSLNRFHLITISAWLAFTVLAGSIVVALGSPLTPAFVVLLLSVGCLPPLVFYVVWQGAPAGGIAQVLRETEQTAAPLTGRLEQIRQDTRHDASI
jgi:hypothetical protein